MFKMFSCLPQVLRHWRHWATAFSIIVDLIHSRQTPDIIAPTLWPPNSQDLNMVDFKVWLNSLNIWKILV